MENSEKDIGKFRTQLGQSGEEMTDVQLKQAMLILDKFADVLFDEWVEELRGANFREPDAV